MEEKSKFHRNEIKALKRDISALNNEMRVTDKGESAEALEGRVAELESLLDQAEEETKKLAQTLKKKESEIK